MIVIEARGPSVRYALSAARMIVGISISKSREIRRSGGEDGLYRCELSNGMIVEVTVSPRLPATARIKETS